MTTATIKQEIAALRTIIKQHNYQYYVLNAPTITDAAFDMLLRRLQLLEQAHPDFTSSKSPTQTVGVQAQQQFNKITHLSPMLSLDNAFSKNEVADFAQKLADRLAITTDLEYVCEPKIDGIAVNLRYEYGELTQGATRGNGSIGEDISANLKAISSIPQRLSGKNIPALVEIRGEVYMSYAALTSLNNSARATGNKLFANTRNAASGSLRQLDVNITAARSLSFFSYGIGYIQQDDQPFNKHSEILAQLQSWGIPVNPIMAIVTSINEGMAFFTSLADKRDNLPYAIDGVVYKVNNLALQKQLGATTRSPRWAIAHKFFASEALSQIQCVEFQVGRSGILTPVAHLTPTIVGGVTITKATLHNMAEITRKDIRINDIVTIRRAGDVIPEIIGPVLAERPVTVTVINLPTYCPACNTVIKPQLAAAYCTAGLSCPAQLKRAIQHFACRNAMNISGLGPQLTELLLKHQVITDVADLYALTLNKIVDLPQLGKKTAIKLLQSIAQSKNTTFARFLYGLGIPQVGEVTARNLAASYNNITTLSAADIAELQQITDIGLTVATAITNFLTTAANQQTIAKLLTAGITWHSTPITGKLALTGQSFAITGTLSSMTRAQAQELLVSMGARLVTHIAKQTDYLIVGQNPGTKLERAQQLGVKILTEDQFVSLSTV
jgi:DNA ligase (NAD+)